MKKQSIIGFLVLDEGQPVRHYMWGGETYYSCYPTGKHAASLFPTRKVAERVKLSLFRKYSQQANNFDPNVGEDNKRCFDLWLKRSKDLRISAVVHDSPSVEDLRWQVKL